MKENPSCLNQNHQCTGLVDGKCKHTEKVCVFQVFATIKKNNKMKTLKELIESGLPVGALVESEVSGDVLQYLYPKKDGGQFYDFRFESEAWFEFTNMKYILTTAHDSGIDPETLPIAEPFWTGFAIRPKTNSEGSPLYLDDTPYQIDTIEPDTVISEPHYIGPGLIHFKDGQSWPEEDCRPCLPPA